MRLPWSQDELAQLRALAGTLTAKKIGECMGRSRDAILNMIRRLALPGAPNGSQMPWTAVEDKKIKRWAREGRTTREIGGKLGRSRVSVWLRERSLGLNKPRKWRWLAQEDARLREAASELSARTLGAELGRSAKAVWSRALILGITLARPKPQDRRGYWPPALEARLRALAATHTAAEAAKALGRSERSVWMKAAKMAVRLRDGRKRLDGKVPVSHKAKAARPAAATTEKTRRPIALVEGRRKPAVYEVCRVEWCKECHAPVSNWGQHYERTGHRRSA